MASRGYKLSTTIGQNYAPLINRSLPIHEQTPKAQFGCRRDKGATNIDLWVDGRIYPHHPGSGACPEFCTVSEFLEFTGEGKNGLLGYFQSLCTADVVMKFKLDKSMRENQKLCEKLQEVMRTTEERDRLLQFRRIEAHEREELQQLNTMMLSQIQTLKSEIEKLQEDLEGSKIFYEEEMKRLNDSASESEGSHLQFEIDFWIEIESLKEKQGEKVNLISAELRRSKAMLKRREVRLQKIVKTPFGYRSIVRPRRDVHTLAPGGGQAKRSLRLARNILLPATVAEIQNRNQNFGSRQRLCGDQTTQLETGKILASMLSTVEVTAMCKSAKMNAVGVRMANHYLKEIGSNVKPSDICETMDRNGITHDGFIAIYKQFKGAVRVAGKGLRVGCLPNPHQVSLARQMLNLKLSEYVGEYYSISDTLEVPAPTKSKTKEPVKVVLNEMNFLFVDVEQVQRTMVELYGITPEANSHGDRHESGSIAVTLSNEEMMRIELN